MEDSPIEVVCANGDLYRSTTPRRHNVQIAARKCSRCLPHFASATARAVQSKDLDIGDPHNVIDICQDFIIELL